MSGARAEGVGLGLFPTPLHHADLGSRLGRLWLKRDDLTGYCWGGNKVRTVEAILTDALAADVEVLVVAGGPSSNFAALLAVAAAEHGVEVRQFSHGHPRGGAAITLAERAGALIHYTGSPDKASMETAALTEVERLRAAGRRVRAVPRGGATAVGARGFVTAAAELLAQLDERGLDRVSVVLPLGSGGSTAGLLAGLAAARSTGSDRVEVVAVAVTRDPAQVAGVVSELAAEVAGGEPLAVDWRVVDGRQVDVPATEATLLRSVGLVADPVYNAPALGWLAAHRDDFSRPVVYWLTGGLLAAADSLAGTPAPGRPDRAQEVRP